jgi:putative transposase
MCQVHFIRAVLKKVPRKDHKFITTIVKEAMSDIHMLQGSVAELESLGFSHAADTVERFQFDLMNFKGFPHEHWRRIRTTNLLERIHKEIKRRYYAIGAFPNDSSLLRIAGSILMDINEEWITGRRYLSDASVISPVDTGAEITAY